MRILLDESLPRRLKRDLLNHEVVTVPEMDWAGKANGDLLALALGHFQVFLTADQNLEYQQRLTASDIVVVVLAAPSNRYDDLRLLVPRLLVILAGWTTFARRSRASHRLRVHRLPGGHA